MDELNRIVQYINSHQSKMGVKAWIADDGLSVCVDVPTQYRSNGMKSVLIFDREKLTSMMSARSLIKSME